MTTVYTTQTVNMLANALGVSNNAGSTIATSKSSEGDATSITSSVAADQSDMENVAFAHRLILKDRLEGGAHIMSMVTITNDTTELTLKWHNPDRKYQGKYYLILRDFYNRGFIDVVETDETSLTIQPARYGHRHMFYSILAQDCRASLRYKLSVKTEKTYPSHSFTNYLEPNN